MEISLVLVTGMGDYTPLIIRVTWHDVGLENAASGEFLPKQMVTVPLWMVSVDTIIILSSFEKDELVCYIFVFLGKDTQESWAVAI